jgi:hypothetical protein
MGTEGKGWEADKGRNTINMAEDIIFISFFFLNTLLRFSVPVFFLP